MRERAITAALRAVHQIFQTVDTISRRLLRDYGVTAPQLWAMRTIHEARGLTIGELSKRMYLHISTVSAILDRLEAGRWVERHRSPEDRRVVRLNVTRKGRELIYRAPEPPRSVVLRGLRALEERPLAETARALQRVLRILENGA